MCHPQHSTHHSPAAAQLRIPGTNSPSQRHELHVGQGHSGHCQSPALLGTVWIFPGAAGATAVSAPTCLQTHRMPPSACWNPSFLLPPTALPSHPTSSIPVGKLCLPTPLRGVGAGHPLGTEAGSSTGPWSGHGVSIRGASTQDRTLSNTSLSAAAPAPFLQGILQPEGPASACAGRSGRDHTWWLPTSGTEVNLSLWRRVRRSSPLRARSRG